MVTRDRDILGMVTHYVYGRFIGYVHGVVAHALCGLVGDVLDGTLCRKIS